MFFFKEQNIKVERNLFIQRKVKPPFNSSYPPTARKLSNYTQIIFKLSSFIYAEETFYSKFVSNYIRCIVYCRGENLNISCQQVLLWPQWPIE